MKRRTSGSGTRRNWRTCRRAPRSSSARRRFQLHALDERPRVAGTADEERVHDLEEVEQRQAGQGQGQARDRVAAEEHAEPVAHLEPTPVGAPAMAEGLHVADTGVRGHDHAGAGDVGPPAEAEVVEEVVDPLVEPADLGEQVRPHEGAGAGDGEHVAHGVVLLLVELAGLDQRHGVPRAVDALAHLEELPGVVPAHELGPDDGGVGAVRLLDEGADHVAVRGDVVVAEQEEGGPVDDVEDLVGGRSVARVPLDPAHEGPRGGPPHPGLHLVAGAGIDHEDRQVRVVLASQGGDRLLEPGSRIVRDDHGHDGRGHRGVGGLVWSGGGGHHGWFNVVGPLDRPGTMLEGSGGRFGPCDTSRNRLQ